MPAGEDRPSARNTRSESTDHELIKAREESLGLWLAKHYWLESIDTKSSVAYRAAYKTYQTLIAWLKSNSGSIQIAYKL